MKVSPVIALGLGNVAMGQFNNVTNPATVGEFTTVGCLKSATGFADWSLVATTEANSIDFCAVSCPSKYFGVENQ